MIKVTLEFHSVPEAIIALNAIMNLPEVKASPVAATVVEAKAARRGRADKGQKRGEYKPRETNAAPQVVNTSAIAGTVAAGQSAPSPCSPEPVAAAPVAPSPAEIVKAEVRTQLQAAQTTIGEKDAEAQKAMEVLHGKKGLDACRVLLGQFGVSRIREIPTARRAEFLEEAGKAAA